MMDVFFSTIAEINAHLVAKDFSAEELARAFCDRLQQLGPRYNALALALPKEALRKAKDADADLKRGRLRGPLQGIPYGVKDLISYADHPTTWGAKPYAEQVFDYSATVVEKLDGVGAVIAGKLSTVELAGGGGYRFASASLTGPGLNPWDPTCWAGGSSSGPAAAVAAGLVPFAIGSETSGSIVTPASFCGVTAIRPTYGLVSRHGAMALSWTLDKLGPFGRSADDCGQILQVIAGGDARDPGSAGKRFYYTPQYTRPLKDLKLGYAEVDFTDRADPSARAAFAEAISVLRAMGVQLMEAKLPDLPYGPVLSLILDGEMASIFEPLVTSGRVDELADESQIAGLKASLEVSAKDYLRAMRIRRIIQQEISTLFTEIDVLLAPGRSGPAPKADMDLNGPAPAPGARVTQASARNTPAGMRGIVQAGNLAGLPALVLPCGFADQLPVALQLVGAPFTENTLLAIGREFQTRTDWHRRRPAV